MQIVIWCSCSYIPVVQELVLMWCVFTSMKLDHQLDFRWVLGSWVCPLERMLTTWAPIHHPCSFSFILILIYIYTFINRCTPTRSWASLYLAACGSPSLPGFLAPARWMCGPWVWLCTAWRVVAASVEWTAWLYPIYIHQIPVECFF